MGRLQFRGQVEAIGVAPALKVRDAAGTVVTEQKWPAAGFDHDRATRELIQTVQRLLGADRIVAVGHRVVHGGTNFSAPVRVDAVGAGRSSIRWCRWRRCISRITSRRSAQSPRMRRICRRWHASILRSTGPRRRWSRRSDCRGSIVRG